MNQKIIIVTAVALLLTLGGVLFFVFKPESLTGLPSPSGFGKLPVIGGRSGTGITPPEIPTPTPEGVPPETPPDGEERRLIQITDEPVAGPAVDTAKQKIFYYKKRDGHLVSNSFVGNSEETISNLTILNILEVYWSPDRKRVVILYQDGNEIKKFVSEATSTPKVTFLPKEASSIAWAPDSKSLLWMQQQNQTTSLISAGPDGKSPKRLSFSSPIPDLVLNIPATGLAALTPKTLSFFETPLIILNLKSFVQNIFTSAFGLSVVGGADPKAQNLTYSSTSRAGALNDLRTTDMKTGKSTAWPIKTVAEKCVVAPAGTVVFCAVPKETPDRGMPEFWYLGKVSTNDAFYMLDTATGKAGVVFSEGNYDAVNLVPTQDNKNLFFIDKKTGFLYNLLLK